MDERRARERGKDRERESDGREVRLLYSREVFRFAAKASCRRQTRRVSLHGNSYQGNERAAEISSVQLSWRREMPFALE